MSLRPYFQSDNGPSFCNRKNQCNTVLLDSVTVLLDLLRVFRLDHECIDSYGFTRWSEAHKGHCA